MANNTKFVIVTPGRVAYTSPAAKEQFSATPKNVVWNAYLQELLTEHGDIQVVNPAEYMKQRNASKAPAKTPQPVRDLSSAS